jgi:hypothetical protein
MESKPRFYRLTALCLGQCYRMVGLIAAPYNLVSVRKLNKGCINIYKKLDNKKHRINKRKKEFY